MRCRLDRPLRSQSGTSRHARSEVPVQIPYWTRRPPVLASETNTLRGGARTSDDRTPARTDGRPGAEGQAPRHVGARRLRRRRHRGHRRPGPALVEAVGVGPGRPGARRRRRVRQRGHPGGAGRRQGRRQRPDPGAASRRAGRWPRGAASRSTGSRATPRRCRTPTACSTSCCPASGVMFAPHHERGADELLRVCRPGGTIGLLSWTPDGFIGQMFATMKPYAPAAAPGAQPPPLWGDEAHVRGPARRPGHRRRGARPAARGSTGSPPPRRSWTSSRRTTGRRSRSTASSPTTPTGSPRSTRAWSSSPAARRGGRTTVMEWEYLLVTARRA